MPSFIPTQNKETSHCIDPDSPHPPYPIYIALSPVCTKCRLLLSVHSTTQELSPADWRTKHQICQTSSEQDCWLTPST